MRVYIINSVIEEHEILNEFQVNTYLDLRIGNQTVKEIFEFSLKGLKFKIVKEIKEIRDISGKVLIISSKFLIFPKSTFRNYIDFITSSFVDVIVGELNSAYLFFGDCSSILKTKKSNNIYRISNPAGYIDLSIFHQLKKIIESNPDSRHFNKLLKKENKYIKESKDKKKLKSEFEFLNNIPDKLNFMYPEVFDFIESDNVAAYEMKAYQFKDFSYQYLSQTVDAKDIDDLLDLLYNYFTSSKINHKGDQSSDFQDLIDKNSKRYDDLKSFNDIYSNLNKYMISMFNVSLDEHYTRIKSEILKRKKIYCNADKIFSHGDLCFSNILFSKKEKKIILIDPRGYENNGIRSPYYDLAKLSHSFLGKYDLIINNRASISNSNDFYFRIIFDSLPDFDENKFLKLVTKLNFNLKLVRLLESSLFFSMLPLHIENQKKCLTLCMRSYEVYNDFINT